MPEQIFDITKDVTCIGDGCGEGEGEGDGCGEEDGVGVEDGDTHIHELPKNICDCDDGVVANGFPIVGVTGTVYVTGMVYRFPLITNTNAIICPGGLQLKTIQLQSANQIVFDP